MPIKFTELAKELKLPNITLNKLIKAKLGLGDTFKGDDKKVWITDDAADRLRLAVEVPLAVPTRLKAYVLRGAPNPRWVEARLEGKDGKVYVAIPRRLYGRLDGKPIMVDRIEDAHGGISYRHESLRG